MNGDSAVEPVASASGIPQLIKKALTVHGLTASQCLAFNLEGSEVILVTKGGQKIRWRPGDPPVEIPAHQHPDAQPAPSKTRPRYRR